jgi:predicted RNase H-like HicB family nuclease
MRTIKYTFWQDGEFYLGFLNDYPDYETQGYSKEELLENLKSLLEDIESEEIPFIRKVEELAIAE